MADTQLPLLGVILCCTSITPEKRVSNVISKVARHRQLDHICGGVY